MMIPILGEAALAPPHPSSHLWPISPLGLPRTPPPLPPVNPQFAVGAFFMPPSAQDLPSPSLPSNAPAAPRSAAPAVANEGWTPVAEQDSKMNRRQFFHTEGAGRELAYNPHVTKSRNKAVDEKTELGTKIELSVDEVHFGNPRVRIMAGEPAPMPQMLKWPLAKYGEHTLECAEIDFGDYRVWSAIGVRSNRLLYAMKRLGVVGTKAIVVQQAAPANEDEVDLTYGTCIQIIQLVP